MEGMNIMMKIPKRSLFIFTLLAILLLCFSATAAEVETVINNDDSGDGSLRWALETVDNGGTISFDVTGVISLDSELEISRNVKIEGPGPDQITITGQDLYRIFRIYSSASSVDISGISFENGNSSNGGAIYFDADNLTIDNCKFSVNSGDFGRAISLQKGNTTVSDSIFENNEAQSGGAIYSKGDLIINNCNFSCNTTTSYGGAVYSKGDYSYDYNARLSVSNSTFQQNYSSGSSGGAIYYNANDLEIINCNFIDNGKTSTEEKRTNQGGSVWLRRINDYHANDVSYKIKDCSFSGNAATDLGGAVYIYNTLDDFPVTVENCAFTDNESTEKGGALFADSVGSLDINNCVFRRNRVFGGDPARGGAIYSFKSNFKIENTTLESNISGPEGIGGAVYCEESNFTLLNSTLSDNSTPSALDVVAQGGGIYNYLSTIKLSNCTISLNSANSGSGIFNVNGEDIDGLTLKNTIIAGNHGIPELKMWLNNETNIESYGNNLIGSNHRGDGGPIPFSEWLDSDIVSPDITSADVFVAEGLADNGGPSVGATISGDQYQMLTLALKEGSPAIDTASSTDISGNVVSTDQRGATRPSPEGGSFDIGAFELQQEPIETFTITTTHTEGGSITTDSDAENSASNYFIPAGESITFEITSDNGYYISQINVDEEPYYTHLSFQKVITEDTYTFDNVSEDHTLSATFAAEDDPVDPVDPDEPNLEGGSCNVGAFTPLAGLLVLPMLLMFKK